MHANKAAAYRAIPSHSCAHPYSMASLWRLDSVDVRTDGKLLGSVVYLRLTISFALEVVTWTERMTLQTNEADCRQATLNMPLASDFVTTTCSLYY